MLQNETVYVAVEGENWIRFDQERMSGTTLPMAVMPDPLETYMEGRGYDEFQIKPVLLQEIIGKLRNDELGVTHVTVVSREGPSTLDKETFTQMMG